MQAAIVAEGKGGKVSNGAPKRKRRAGIPTGNAGEYFVMGELLRRGYDAQLADRNTQNYDILVGLPDEPMRRVQVKTVRAQPWYVKVSDFSDRADQITIYVLIGTEDCRTPVRYFIVRNSDVAEHVHRPAGWQTNGFMKLATVKPFENKWELLFDR